MRNFAKLAGGISIAASIAILASPVLAEGKADRAREAIAAASAKVDAANKVGASGEVPHLQAEAQAALRDAQEDLKSGHKDEAIAAANHASELADTAIGISHRNAVDQQRETAASATNAAMSAQEQAAAANARADAAQQAAASAQADAAAARAQPPVVVTPPAPQPQPQPIAATVTTETEEVAPTVTHASSTHRVVRRSTHRVVTAKPVVKEKTSTSITTAPQN
ncbi:MAG: hypothetical protein ACRCSO_11345 [Sphingomonas sp.]